MDAQCSTASRIAVEFGEDDAAEVESVVECLGGLHGVLSSHGVHHKQDLVRLNNVAHRRNLIHQHFVNGQTSRSVHNGCAVSFCLGFGHPALRNADGVFHTGFRIHVCTHTLAHNVKLVHSRRTVNVARNEQGLASGLGDPGSQLSRVGRFASPLQSCKKDGGRACL